MRASVLDGPHKPFRLEERPVPKAGPGEAVVRVRACGAGLTIQHTKAGRAAAKFPIVIGHEIAGEVTEVGPGAEGLRVGERVTPHFYLTCGRCKWCRLNRETLCENLLGHIGRDIDGGYAEYVKLPARNLVPLPDSLPYEEHPAEVAVICDAVATPYKVVRRARLAPLEDVLVVGAGGGVGIHMVMMARWAGARVIGVDLGEAKLQAAMEAGAHAVIDASKDDVVGSARRLTGGRGVDVAISFVGSPKAMEPAFRSLGPGGRLIALAGAAEGPFSLHPRDLLSGEREVLGSRYVTKQELIETLALVARGDIWPKVTERVPFELEAVEEIHRRLEEGSVIGRAVVVFA
ncbi:MAG: alcohol dehydrogenase catalytic domain-containing protein, partial [Nitrospinota bacterium]